MSYGNVTMNSPYTTNKCLKYLYGNSLKFISKLHEYYPEHP
jgi:hypothetical protein